MLRRLLVMLALFSFTNTIFAEENKVVALDQMKISKQDILGSLDQLRKAGQISEEDYQKAKKQLEGMSDSQVKGIQDKAVGIIKENPGVVNEVMESKKVSPEDIKKTLEKKKK